MVVIHRWSLYAAAIAWEVYTWGPVKCGLYKQVVCTAALTVVLSGYLDVVNGVLYTQQKS